MDFEKMILNKIDNYEKLSEDEIRKIVLFYELEEFREIGENRRWSRSIFSICNIEGRYFGIDWEEGLTEYQPNEYFTQPVEMRRIDKKVYTVTTTFEEINELRGRENSQVAKK